MQTTRDLFLEVARSHGIQGVDFSEPASRFVQANGLRSHYLDWGGSGAPILFLHGGGQTAHTWDFVCLLLRERFHCFALDLRGHGESERKSDKVLDPFTLGEDIQETVLALGLSNLVTVGMSLGGLTGMAYGARQPRELRGLVLVDITPTVHHENREEAFSFNTTREFDSFDQAVDRSARLNPYRPRIHHQFSLMHLLERRHDGKWVWKAHRSGANSRPATPEDRDRNVKRFADLWPELPKIACPTLVVHGGASDATYREDAERLVRLVQHGRVVTIPRATHVVQGDQPSALAREIAGFVSDLA